MSTCIFCLIFEYFILYTTGYVYYFFEDHVEIIYYFRIIRRKKIIDYKSIKKIRYNVDPYKGNPELHFFLETQRLPKFISCFAFKKGGMILHFFKKKNIEIEIICTTKRRRRIVENELYKE